MVEIGITGPNLDFRRWVRGGVWENNKGKNEEERQKNKRGEAEKDEESKEKEKKGERKVL